jgi:hypothetical protein
VTEKMSILYVSAKIQQSRIMCDRLEKLDSTGNNAMFGDDDINCTQLRRAPDV